MLRRTAPRSIAEYKFGQPNLSQPFKGATKAAASEAKDHGVKITKLSNGAKVITHNKEGSQVAVGLYADAGAIYDPAGAPGLNYVLRWGLTTANFENSLFQIDRTIRSYGAAADHLEVRKRFIGLRLEARPDSWKAPFDNYVTTLAAPRFAEPDIERFRDTMDNLASEARWQRPREYTVDRLETVAFYKENLGSPRFVLPESNDACSSEKLMLQYSKYITPSRVVIAGVNVDHNELVSTYENNSYPHSETAPHHVAVAADAKKIDFAQEDKSYTGGEFHEQENRAKEMGTKPDMESETIVALGFKSFGRINNVKDFAAAFVTQQLFNVNIEDGFRYNRLDTTHGVRSFYRPYTGTGLIGLTVHASPSTITKEVIDASKLFKSTKADNLAIGKARAAAAFYAAELEQSRDYCDFLGTNFSNKDLLRISPEDIFAAIEGVTAADVKRVIDLASSSKPSIWVSGETLSFPSLRQLGL
ncbi:mitochondrial processing peptidase alpha subunit, putative [Bodo saltans]|uniref:Mitochondrial processing peptidase alpha subunit, putative n=1 Tax=Bodo saltans TaxID=75058 RepID=A0A0S4JST8_BODSA|nr:mitochondrial processing peptidase alpha subunit, putative [Bodo saltans]|eukprot:CUG92401.1 mitochondrial processing peptidase alpha subunit, putative [Bodo saltans]